jgi:hypothetical protein
VERPFNGRRLPPPLLYRQTSRSPVISRNQVML